MKRIFLLPCMLSFKVPRKLLELLVAASWVLYNRTEHTVKVSLFVNQRQHYFNQVFLTGLAVFSGESFHAETLVSIFLVQRNAFTSLLTGRTVAQRLHRGKHIAVSNDH